MATLLMELPAQRAARLAERQGSVQFIGTATVLIRYAGYTILTDPNFVHKGDSVHLGYGLFSKRLTDPGLFFDQIPPVDLVVVSHLHADHFDRVAMARLNRSLPIICPPAAARTLRKKGFFRATGLATWDSLQIAKPDCLALKIQAMPARHASGMIARLLPPGMGSVLEFGEKSPFRVYLSGDTLLHKELREIPYRVPQIHLALLHLGGTRILGETLTMDDQQGLEALRILQPQLAVPIHYNDYGVFKSGLEDFERAIASTGWKDRVQLLRQGETLNFEYQSSRVWPLEK